MKEDEKSIIKEVFEKKLSFEQSIIFLYKNGVSKKQILELIELNILPTKRLSNLNNTVGRVLIDNVLEKYFFEVIFKNSEKLIKNVENNKNYKKYNLFWFFEDNNLILIVLEKINNFDEFKGIIYEIIGDKANIDYINNLNKLNYSKPKVGGIYYTLKKNIYEFFISNKVLFSFKLFRIVEVFEKKEGYGVNFLESLTKKSFENGFNFNSNKELESYLKKHLTQYQFNKFKHYFNIFFGKEKDRNILDFS
jgi:hypothetical protein